MLKFLHPELQKFIGFKLYRYRFLFTYILIGFASICAELIIFRSFSGIITPLPAKITGVIAGILLAFFLNVRFNFKVPSPKRRRAFLLFSGISVFSLLLNIIFNRLLANMKISYEISRLAASGSLFYIGYILHRRFSFHSWKQVGVAIYAHGVEDIKSIWEKIQAFSDFIHVDIVDSTFNKKAPDPALYRLEAVRAYWPQKEIQVHIMSRTPSLWLDKVLPHSDLILIHHETDENTRGLIEKIRAAHKKPGIACLLSSNLEEIKTFLPLIDEIMLLCIPSPGESGQKFDVKALDLIEQINSWPGRQRISLCIDGGVNERIIHLLQVEKVISGSSVLNNENPVRQIMRLQTSSQYEEL
ncbi:MAG: hypothetical protein A2096_02280 [Spirochaetes bacterium GWF1_41_5]|nr:MAG: hypothetical protein A2096_02280 [Spirochaetes bacterium GWF1_41_5]HBE04383.1 hypothetical protein [Spirochaetia bacterium]